MAWRAMGRSPNASALGYASVGCMRPNGPNLSPLQINMINMEHHGSPKGGWLLSRDLGHPIGIGVFFLRTPDMGVLFQLMLCDSCTLPLKSGLATFPLKTSRSPKDTHSPFMDQKGDV